MKEKKERGVKKGKELQLAAAKKGKKAKPKNNCKKCFITAINKAKFRKKSQSVTFRVKEDRKSFVLEAVPSQADCPCEWSEMVLEYSVILTGKKDIKRKSIFTSLNETKKFDATKNPAHFSFNGCKLTIKISKINDDLRNGRVRRGANPLRQVMVPLRLAGKVRCGTRWRRFQVVFLDA